MRGLVISLTLADLADFTWRGLAWAFFGCVGELESITAASGPGGRFLCQWRYRHSKSRFWTVHLWGISLLSFYSASHDAAVPRCCSKEKWKTPLHAESSACTKHKTTEHLASVFPLVLNLKSSAGSLFTFQLIYAAVRGGVGIIYSHIYTARVV